MAASTNCVNEVLCFLLNNFGKVPKRDILSTIIGFYDETELADAKQLLFHIVEDLEPKVTDVPRYKIRKEAMNKRRLDSEDIFGLVEFLDKRQLLTSLLTFMRPILVVYREWRPLT